MKIGIDVSQILYGTGVSLYTSSLVKTLSAVNRVDDFILFAASLRRKKELKDKIDNLSLSSNFKTKLFPLPPFVLEKLWNSWHVVNIENFLGKIDVFHASDWTQPPAKTSGMVTTIHDLAFFHYPDHFSQRVVENHKKRLKWIEKDGVEVIAVSQSTKKDILKYTNIKEDKINLIYEAIPKEHQIKVLPGEIKEFKAKNQLEEYLLFVGTGPRKNLKQLISSFQTLQKTYPKLKLIIVGRKEEGGQTGLSKKKDEEVLGISFWKDVDSKKLALLYSGASCFVYPSLYEGFGLPVLEAMFYGCPVVASNVASIPEVAGKAAVLIDPLSKTDLTRALTKLLKDKSLVFSLKKLGYRQIKKFSWNETAQKTLRIYQRIADENRH